MRKTIKQFEDEVKFLQETLDTKNDECQKKGYTIQRLERELEASKNREESLQEQTNSLIKREALTREILPGEASIKSKMEVLSDLTGVNRNKDRRFF